MFADLSRKKTGSAMSDKSSSKTMLERLAQPKPIFAMAAFASLAMLYAGHRDAAFVAERPAQLAKAWPNLAGTPAQAPASGSEWQTLNWSGMDSSAAFASIRAQNAAKDGETDIASPLSLVRVGRPGEPVELDVRGLAGTTPTHIGVESYARTDAEGKLTLSDRSYTAEVSGLRPARIEGQIYATTLLAADKGSLQDRSQSLPPVVAPMTAWVKPAKQQMGLLQRIFNPMPSEDEATKIEPESAEGPGVAKISAQALPGEAQVVWAWTKKTVQEGNPGAARTVVIGAGSAPLSVYNEAREQWAEVESARESADNLTTWGQILLTPVLLWAALVAAVNLPGEPGRVVRSRLGLAERPEGGEPSQNNEPAAALTAASRREEEAAETPEQTLARERLSRLAHRTTLHEQNRVAQQQTESAANPQAKRPARNAM